MSFDKRWDKLLTRQRFRPVASTAPTDHRDPFENDYSRLIPSPFIRRLQDKTQVFPLEKSDFIRTRLTHSLEVSSIARSIGKSVESELIKRGELNLEYAGYIPSLLLTTGLIHDLGNPPFGHFGETAIKDFFTSHFRENPETAKRFTDRERADFENFDGNVQALRILRKLHFLLDEYSYNLTFPSLSTIIKYPRTSLEGNKGKAKKHICEKKFGYFVTEEDDFNRINAALELNSNRHPVTYLLEAADDIAYSAADIEDGVKLGILNFETIQTIFESCLGRDEPGYVYLLDKLSKDHKELKDIGLDRLDITIQRFRIASQSMMIVAVVDEFLNNYESFMDGTYPEEILDRCKHAPIRQAYKKLLELVIKNKKIIHAELAGYQVLTGLLEEFIPACLEEDFGKEGGNNKPNRLYSIISSNYRHIYENHNPYRKINPLYSKYQLVVDMLSGMTDHYALTLYQNIKGIEI